ncbi:MAG: hypothetical protein LBS27_10355 [Bifidobacteriaceae bacterium]|jgi:folate-binding protein YgfZ|nr:hypothetical protein [Bifidobacteriaceae bacterium]
MARHDLAGQRAFDGGEPVYALSDAVGVVSLQGPDSLRLLSALTTVPPGGEIPAGGSQALLLDANGHIQFGLAITPAGDADQDSFTLITDGSATSLAELINSRRFRLRTEATARPDLRTLVTPGLAPELAPGLDLAAFEDHWPNPPQPARPRLGGAAPDTGAGPGEPRAETVRSGAGAAQANGAAQCGAEAEPTKPAARSAAEAEPAEGAGRLGRPSAQSRVWPRYALDSPHPGTGWTGSAIYVYDPAADEPLPRRLEALGYRQIGVGNLEALRVAAWRPLAGREAGDGKTLPHELDWLRATTPLNSGCYPGQETVAKVINVGKPPRRLVFLHLDGSDAAWPKSGAAVFALGQNGAEPLASARDAGLAAEPEGESAAGWGAPSDGTRTAGAGAGSGAGPGSGLAAGRVALRGDATTADKGARPVGHVTSVGVHHELGPIALALVKRSLPEDIPLAVAVADAPGGLVAALQTTIVPASGESDARPARRRPPVKLSAARRR